MAVKLHTGERGNQNFLRPEFVKPLVDKVNGTVVECNTAYGHDMGGHRFNTMEHEQVLREHGWSENFNVEILDAAGPDLVLDIPNGLRIRKTTSAGIWTNTTPCWCCPTARATPWADSAGR